MIKNKILLVHPEISRTKYNFAGVIENEPLELEYISAILQEKKYEVQIFDKAVEKGSLKEKIETFNITRNVVNQKFNLTIEGLKNYVSINGKNT